MAVANRYIPSSLLFSYDNTSFYLESNRQGFSLYAASRLIPLFQLHEPVVLVQGIATSSHIVHLAFLKTNGELCYTLLPVNGSPQTTVLSKLEVRFLKFRRLVLLPQGERVHIFYACAHQSVPDLWRIDHLYWNGQAWRSARLSEVVQPRSPLYHVSLDPQGNIHFVALTTQGRQSLLLHNRFHGVFGMWNNPSAPVTIPNEAIDMAAILTPDAVHHMFWVTKHPAGQYEIRLTKRPRANDLSSSWETISSTVTTVNGPWRRIGAIEAGGKLYLLISADQEQLLCTGPQGWQVVAGDKANHRPLDLIRTSGKTFYSTQWSEDSFQPRSPVFYRQLGWPAAALPAQPQPVPTSAALNASSPATAQAHTKLPESLMAPTLAPDDPQPPAAQIQKSITVPPAEADANPASSGQADSSIQGSRSSPRDTPPLASEPAPAPGLPELDTTMETMLAALKSMDRQGLGLTLAVEAIHDRLAQTERSLQRMVEELNGLKAGQPAHQTVTQVLETSLSPAQIDSASAEQPPDCLASPGTAATCILSNPEILRPLLAEAVIPLSKALSFLEQEQTDLMQAFINNHQRTESFLLDIQEHIRQLQVAHTGRKEKGFWKKWFA